MAEAAQAGEVVHRAALKLLAGLQRGETHALTERDFDRLEAAAFDLERRALAAHDCARQVAFAAEVAAEIESLQEQARTWLTFVRDNRVAGSSTCIQQLRHLLP